MNSISPLSISSYNNSRYITNKNMKNNIGFRAVTSAQNIKPELSAMVEKLAGYKDAEGKQLIHSEAIRGLLDIKNRYTIGENFLEKVEAVLSNPEEVYIITQSKNRGWALLKAMLEPLDSTVKANPKLF